MIGTGKGAQMVKCLLGKQELTLDPQYPPKKLDVAVCICNPSTGGVRDKRISEACWPASPAHMVRSGLAETLSRKIRWMIEEDIHHWPLTSICTYTHVHACAHVLTHMHRDKHGVYTEMLAMLVGKTTEYKIICPFSLQSCCLCSQIITRLYWANACRVVFRGRLWVIFCFQLLCNVVTL